MKRTLCMLLALIMLIALPGCGDGGDNPLALYKDGEPIVWLGMSRDEVYEALGGDESEDPTTAKVYEGFTLVYEKDIVAAMKITSPLYTDWRGIHTGMKRKDITGKYSEKEITFLEDENTWEMMVAFDDAQKIVSSDGEIRYEDYHYLIGFTSDETGSDSIDNITIVDVKG